MSESSRSVMTKSADSGLPASTPAALTNEVLEAVVVNGDLTRLAPAQRLEWYKGRCEAAGLDPRTQPFAYLNLNGKLTLYATKAATDQLISAHRLSVTIMSRQMIEGGIYEVVVRVQFPDGRIVEDIGACPIPESARGEMLSNLRMKAVTKAKRRAVLSACGLGMMDVSEIEDIPARVVRVDDRGEILEQAERRVDIEESAPMIRHTNEDDQVAVRALDELIGGELEKIVDAFLADEVQWGGNPWLEAGKSWRTLPKHKIDIIIGKWESFHAKIEKYRRDNPSVG